jgi:hypothetical protein
MQSKLDFCYAAHEKHIEHACVSELGAALTPFSPAIPDEQAGFDIGGAPLAAAPVQGGGRGSKALLHM